MCLTLILIFQDNLIFVNSPCSHRADSAADIAISLVIFGNYLVYCSYYHWHYELPVKCKQKTKDRVGDIGDIGIFHKSEFSVCLQSGND